MARTVKVRIAVGVDKDGDWNAYGGCKLKDIDAMSFAVEVLGEGEARYWLTAELALPEEIEVSAEVQDVS